MFVTITMSGFVNDASQAICPRPRIASSATHTSVSLSMRQRVSGTPISVL